MLLGLLNLEKALGREGPNCLPVLLGRSSRRCSQTLHRVIMHGGRNRQKLN